jgi:hypothetical protein
MWRRASVVLGVLALLAGALYADDYDKRTVVRFHEPVIVAGVETVTLPPGTYVVKLMRHDHNRNIVQFFNEREDHLCATVLAIPKFRLERGGETEFSFWETPTGNPIALRSWFSVGDQVGQEFVYPKGLAVKIAREAGEPVLVSEAATEPELLTAPIEEVTETGELQEAEVAAAPAAEPAAAREVETIAEPEPVPEPEPPAELPATASPFFAAGLLGVLAASAGFLLRRSSLARR